MPRILFIGHEAGRTGAPFLLLHLLRWIKRNRHDIDAELLLLRDGDLREAYEAVVDPHVVPPSPLPGIILRGSRFIRRKLGIAKKFKPPDLPPLNSDYDLVVGNTVGSLEYLHLFKQRGMRTVCWLHEMRSVIDSFVPEPGRFMELSRSVDLFIVASEAVERVFRSYGVTTPSERVYEFSDLAPADRQAAGEVRRVLGIPGRAFVVGGSGTVSDRKGTDLFVRIAAELAGRFDDMYFLWVGGASSYSEAEFDEARSGIQQAGLSHRIFITGTQPNPQDYFANLDLFALTSREDPFPLVCLEAASLSIPVICFDEAGGMPEFVGDDAGAIVPFGDVDAFARAIENFYRDRDALASAGAAANRKINNEFSLDSSCRKLTDLLVEMSS